MSDYSDDDRGDLFDRLAAAKYASQADLSDDDSVFNKPKRGAAPKKVLAAKMPVAATPSSDEDLADIEAELNAPQVDPARLKQLQDELAKYELLRKRAVEKKLDAVRLGKVDKKIAEIKAEIAAAQPRLTLAQEREVQKLEREVADLEKERTAVEQKLTAAVARLRQLKPHKSSDDWLNDPSQLGGRVVDGQFVEVDDGGEDDYEQMAAMIAARRRQAQQDGQYNSNNHVKVIRRGPQPTSDSNPGF